MDVVTRGVGGAAVAPPPWASHEGLGAVGADWGRQPEAGGGGRAEAGAGPGSGVKVSAIACRGSGGVGCRQTRCTARWANGKVWVALRSGGESWPTGFAPG